MNFGVFFEQVREPDFPAGFFHAHVPTLGLTTHSLGVDGARAAALDLVRLWLEDTQRLPTLVACPSFLPC